MSEPTAPIGTKLTRYDRNLAFNVTDFSRYSKDATLIKNLVAFFAYDISYNVLREDLFGKKILDPNVYAKHMGYKNYRSLIKKHPHPAQYEGKSPEAIEHLKRELQENKEPAWDTDLCNALYRMRYESLRFTKPGKTPNGLSTSELKEIRFLKHAIKFFDPVTKKIYYEIEYDETFVNNHARYFMKFYKDVYTALRKPGLQDLYIYLINLRDSVINQNPNAQQLIADNISFDKLCLIAGVHSKINREMKRRLIKSFEKVNGLIGSEAFKLTWGRKGRHNYQPIITFIFTDNEILSKESEHTTRLKLFYHTNLKLLFRNLPNVHFHSETDFKNKFVQWLCDHELNIGEKLSLFRETYIQCFGKDINHISTENQDKIKTILNQLSTELNAKILTAIG